MTFNDCIKEAVDTIDFLTQKISNIKDKCEMDNYMQIKDISDIQRYSESLMALSTYINNLENFKKNGEVE